MTSQTENELLTRVGPGTAMGTLMRQYWLPACLSSELVTGGDPLRLMLLGERLIAFRDSSGRVGILDHRCPHRCASLFVGRNEGGGLRCIYHGWKFDTAGNCLEMPNLPADQSFQHKVKAKADAVAERGGLVYVYMGEREVAPPLPALEATLCPPDETDLSCRQRECNWLQALEGDIDTSHFSFLHTGKVEVGDIDPDHMDRFQLIDRAPQYHVHPTDWGTMYTAYRPAQPGHLYYRYAHFVMPFWTCFRTDRSPTTLSPRRGFRGRHPHHVVQLQLEPADSTAQRHEDGRADPLPRANDVDPSQYRRLVWSLAPGCQPEQ